MRVSSGILYLFRNEFDKFNNTGAQILDSINHMALKVFCNRIFSVKCQDSTILRKVITDVIMLHN